MNLTDSKPEHRAFFEQPMVGASLTGFIHPKRVLRKKEVCALCGFSGSTLANRINSASPWYDETFPKPICLGAVGKRGSAKGWLAEAIFGWLASRQQSAH